MTDIRHSQSSGNDAPGVVRHTAVSPKVAALLKLYGIEARLVRPQACLLEWAASLHAALVSAAGADDAADYLMAVDARRLLFMLEGLLRLYRKRYGKPLERPLDRTKELEDQLGAVGYAQDMLEAARHAQLPKKALRQLESERRKEHKRLAKLIAKRWAPERNGCVPAIAALVRAVTQQAWDAPQADVQFVRQEIGRRLGKLEAADYDMGELEKGLHELRRQIRWLPIYLTALDGVAELTDVRHPIPFYEPLLRDPIAESKYAALPPPAPGLELIRISRSLYLANTKLIDELGVIKDEGQVVEAVAAALRAAGVAHSKKKAHKKARDLLGETGDDAGKRQARANEIYAELQRYGLVGALRGEILHGT